MSLRVLIAADVEGLVTWEAVVEGLRAGHRLPRADVRDTILTRGKDTLLSRSAWIAGLGVGVKSVTVVPGNAGRDLPTVQGAMLVFDDETGSLKAAVDSDVVTGWKTAADSVLGAMLLARPEPRTLVIVGAGEVAGRLAAAYRALFPTIADIRVWNRTPERAAALVGRLCDAGLPARTSGDLPSDVAAADIVGTATMSREPVLRGDWVGPGTHVDLIGAFRPDMREADDALLRKARLFVDSRETTLDHIGELMIPLREGVITRPDVRADLYDLVGSGGGRRSDAEITVFKNGGGAHLDLMTADILLRATKDVP